MTGKTLEPTEAPLPEVWEHTHTIAGIPVMRVEQPFIGKNPHGRLKWWPNFYDCEWKKVKPMRYTGKAIPVNSEPEPVIEIEVREEEQEQIVQNGVLELLDVDVAQAVLRAAAWPIYAESMGYFETLNGCSATVIGVNSEGHKIVNVCVPGRMGGNFVKVIVPRLIAFQIAEDTHEA